MSLEYHRRTLRCGARWWPIFWGFVRPLPAEQPRSRTAVKSAAELLVISWALVLVPQFASSEPDLQPGLYYHSYHSGDDWMHHGPFATLAECEAAAEAHHVERDTVAARCRFHPVWPLMSSVPELAGWANEATYTSQEECLKVIKDHAQEVANNGFHWEYFHEQHQPPAPSPASQACGDPSGCARDSRPALHRQSGPGQRSHAATHCGWKKARSANPRSSARRPGCIRSWRGAVRRRQRPPQSEDRRAGVEPFRCDRVPWSLAYNDGVLPLTSPPGCSKNSTLRRFIVSNRNRIGEHSGCAKFGGRRQQGRRDVARSENVEDGFTGGN